MPRLAPTLLLLHCMVLPAIAQQGLIRARIAPDMEVVRIRPHVYVHISYANLPAFGRFGSNGLIYTVNGEALLFDTPATDSLTERLVAWISDSLKSRIIGFVPNHWHNDCMGGLGYLNKTRIPTYAFTGTIEAAKTRNLPLPRHAFPDSLILHLGGSQVICKYFGRAHTADNIVTWIPSEGVLFAGCMVKDTASKTLGNIADADMAEWPGTIERVTAAFPSVRIVIPGHGAFGGPELLRHTADLLQKMRSTTNE